MVSLGPGSADHLTPKAAKAIDCAQVVVGYKTYIGLLEEELLIGKEVVSTGMTREIERCSAAISKSVEGKRTAVVCSGDAGIYAMAGLILELLHEQDLLEKIKIEVIPGVPALAAASALLGAPLMHDFASVSLSDLLTPWEIIQNRIRAAAEADFVLVFYNPKSKSRDWQLGEALRIVLEYRAHQTPLGVVRSAGRDEESVLLDTLGGLDCNKVDMLSTVVVGNSQTKVLSGFMVTPRGYKIPRNL